MSLNDELDFKPSVLLRDGIDFQKMTTDTIVPFETDTEFLHQLELNKMENDNSDSEEPKFFGYQDVKEWIDQPFESLRLQMAPVGNSNLIRKAIIVPSEGALVTDDAVIRVRFNGFCEGTVEPFTCTEDNKTVVMHLADGGQLPGLNMALRTMKIGEYSRFLLSYKVMYGELGCPPLIPAKADCLFNILVVGVVPVVDDRTDMNDEENSSFKIIYEKAVALHISGKMFFEKHEYSFAVRSFKSAVNYLEFSRLKDETEELKQQKFLAKLYLNLAICYNKLKMPLKACSMCNQLHYMGKLWNNSKALLHNGRALMMIGDYGAAERKLRTASKRDPNCPNIKNEISILEEKKNIHAQHEVQVSQKLHHSFTVYREKVTEPNQPSVEFTNSVDEFCTCILNNKDVITATLPGGLTKVESDEVKRVVNKHKLFCDDTDIVTYVSKIQLSDVDG